VQHQEESKVQGEVLLLLSLLLLVNLPQRRPLPHTRCLEHLLLELQMLLSQRTEGDQWRRL
jgi:hypothetical protein